LSIARDATRDAGGVLSKGTIVFYAATSSGGSSFTPFLLIVAFVVVIYFVLLRPNRRRQQAARQAHQDMLNNLGHGTKIVTIGGLHGTIVDSDADSVTLEISPGVTARYDRAAIAKVVPDDVDDTMSSDGVAYEDDDDIVDGADLDGTHRRHRGSPVPGRQERLTRSVTPPHPALHPPVETE
jgi:preprotein translocase subunit YajC